MTFFIFSGIVGFFVKYAQTGMCINDPGIIEGTGKESWGNLTFVQLSDNCFDPAAQFRFRDNGAMLNLKRPGCFSPQYRASNRLDVFYIYVSSKGLDTAACSDPVTQTSWGGLSVRYARDKKKIPLPTTCVVPKTDQRPPSSPGQRIDPYIGLTTDCNDGEDKRFNFGKFLYRLVNICNLLLLRFLLRMDVKE